MEMRRGQSRKYSFNLASNCSRNRVCCSAKESYCRLPWGLWPVQAVSDERRLRAAGGANQGG